ncbi:MAG: sugar phosphate nucleotidyltransferase [bacterium]|nr:sugar phosphate nucleotidyltransferase [bacterium]
MKESVQQAVILAGGKGERLMPFTANQNKGMVYVAGKPFLEHLILLFKRNGIRRFLILTGHAADSITDYFGNGERFGVEIMYHYLPPEINHGKRLELSLHLIDDFFLLHKCDIYWPFNLELHLSQFQKVGLPALMTVYINAKKDGIYGPENNVHINEKGVIERYDNFMSEDPFYQGQDIGFCLFQKKVIVNNLPPGNFSLHDGLLSGLARKGLLSAFETKIPATTTTDAMWLKKAEHYFKHTLPTLRKRHLEPHRKTPQRTEH